MLTNIAQLINAFGGIIAMLIPIMIGVAILAFFYGLYKYIKSAGEGHTEGINIMIAGIAALFVMVSIWGIIGFVQSSLNISNTQTVSAPRIPTQ